MVLPQPFTTANPVVATYGYTDIADGTNKQLFYASSAVTSAATTYFLTTQTTAGAKSGTYGAILEGAIAEQNFDLTPFNTPRTVKGTAVFSGTIGIESLSGTVKAQIKHVRGATVTNISSQFTSPSISATSNILMLIPLTEKLFAEGDILRVSIDFNGTNIGQGFGIDPSGASKVNGTVALNPCIIEIPFKLEV